MTLGMLKAVLVFLRAILIPMMHLAVENLALEFHREYSLKPIRCHLMGVSGWKKAKKLFQNRFSLVFIV